MTFNSYLLLWFVPLAFLAYWGLNRRGPTARNLWVVASGFIFYGWWDWRFLFLIMAIIAAGYSSGLLLGRLQSRTARRGVVWGAAVVDLGILLTFKYFNFFTRNLAALGSMWGVMLDTVTLDLVLPVGISFYTFQGLAYTIDCYRRTVAPTRNLPAFAAFISFFPQLVAGPIERASNLLPQFLGPARFDSRLATEGCRQILWGLFKKVVVADHCAMAVNAIFHDYGAAPWWLLALGAFLFTVQIYGDFSGYSDIAIGLAKLFGIRLRPNFRTPFLSKDPKEFWTRWHISLSSWFKDYLYIPLGGSRKGKLRKAVNLTVVFLVSGLWHGASWTFLLWGAMHAAGRVPVDFLPQPKKSSRWRRAASVAATFIFVVIAFVPFRADGIHEAFGYLGRMFALRGGAMTPSDAFLWQALPWALLLLLIDWLWRGREFPLQLAGNGLMRYAPARWTLYYTIALLVILMAGQATQFIYFQF